jgi:hypothetical protein
MFDKPFVSVYILPEVLFLVEVSSNKSKILQSIRLDLPKGLIKNYVVTDVEVLSQMLTKIWAKYKIKEKNVAIVLSEFAAFTKRLTLPKVPLSEMHEAVLWAMQEYLPEESENMLFDWKIISQGASTSEIFVVAIRKISVVSVTDSFRNAGILPFFVEIPSISLSRMDDKKKANTLIVYQDHLVSLIVSLKEGNVMGSSVVRGDDAGTLLATAKKMSMHYSDVPLSTLYFSGYSKELYDNLEKTFGLIPKPLLKDGRDDQQGTHNEYIIPLSLATSKLSPPSDPTTINLLPDQYIENYSSSTQKVQFWGLILTVTLFVWIALFASLGTYLFISQSAASLKSSNASKSQEQKRTDTANLVKQINTTTDEILSIKAISIVPQDVLNIINMSRPEGISISQYRIDFDLGDIKIDGVAKDRLALIEFKQNIQKNEVFGSVDIPISNFETETDLSFTLSAKYIPISKNIVAKPAQPKKTVNP